MENKDVWEGEPEWSGVITLDFDQLYCPCSPAGAPLIILLEGTEEQFAPCFTTQENLITYVRETADRLPISLDSVPVAHIPKELADEYFDLLRKENINIMVDPVNVSPHHTRWYGVIKEGDKIKFKRSEL